MKTLASFLLALYLCTSLAAQNLQQGVALFEQKKYAEAKKIFTILDDDHQDYAQAQYYLGRMAFDEQKYEDAADFFDEAVDTNEKVAIYHYWLGAAYGSYAQQASMIKQGILAPKIKNAFEKCVALDGKNKDCLSGLIQYYIQAPSFMGGDLDKALANAKALKNLDKEQGTVLLAQIYTKQGKHAEAEKEYVELLAAKPNDANTVLAVGSAYVTQQKYQKALDLYDNFLKQNPANMAISYQFGKVAAISGLQLDKGETCLQSYLKYKPAKGEPSIGGAYFRLGMIYEKRGNKAEAKKLYQTAIQQDKNLKEAQEALKRMS